MRRPGREHYSLVVAVAVAVAIAIDMKASHCVVLMCVLLGAVDSLRHPDHRANEVSPDHEALAESERKLLLECQHTDYRAYIKCLKREKRQHHGNDFRNTRACLDECFEQNCTNSTCLRDCHSHCRKRLIETYSKTVETSFDCADGECSESRGSNSPNITTIVNVTNLLPNVTRCDGSLEPSCRQGDVKCGQGSANSNCDRNTQHSSREDNRKPEQPPKIDINNIINNQFGSGFYPGAADCACPGCNCYPYNPWQSSPQITIGIGSGPMAGCMYSMAWPCFQRFPAAPIDCSICNNPFMRYRCDPACTADPRRNHTQTTTERPPTAFPWTNSPRKF